MAIDDFRTQAEAMRGLLGNLGVTEEDYRRADRAKVKAATDSVEADMAADPLVAPQHYASAIKDEKGTFGLLKDAFFGEMKGPLAAMLAPEYVAKKQQYATDLKAYAGAEEERLKLGVMDPQVEAYARMYDEIDPKRAAYIRAANKVKEFDGNDRIIGEGQTLLNGFDSSVTARGPEKLTTAEKNFRAYQGMAEDPDGQDTFSGFVRAPQNINGTLIDPLTGRPVGGSIEPFIHNTVAQAGAEESGKQGVKSADKMFSEGYTSVREAGAQFRDYGDRMETVQTAIDGFADGTYDTNFVRGTILKATGLGSYGDGELQAMGTDEAINKVTNFNGHTTDFEYGEAFKAAFANVVNNVDVNQATLDVVMRGLEKGQAEAMKQWQGGVADMVNNAQTDGERLALARQNTFNRRQFSNAPDIGTKEDGRIYIGGNPGTPDNWLEVK